MPALTTTLRPILGPTITYIFSPQSGARQLKIYVNSISGSDANSGLSPDQAKQTLAGARAVAVSGAGIAFSRGSLWREMFEIRQAGTGGGATFRSDFQVYGTGDPPVISGADVIASNLFTLSAHADAGGVTYQYNWVRGVGFEDGVDKVMLWENDARLYRRTSVALVAANPGSYYAVDEEGVTSVIYIHPYGSTSPIVDGKSYEVTKRGAAIECYAPGNEGTNVSGPLHLLRGWAHVGPMAGPWRGGKADRILVGGGGLHTLGTSAAEITDAVLYDPPLNYGTGFFPYTAYFANGLGLLHKATRVISHGSATADATSKAFNGGFYCHGATNGFDKVTYEQCYQSYASKGFSCTNPEIVSEGCFVDNCTLGILGADNTAITIKYLMAKYSRAFSDDGTIDLRSKTRLIENCAIHINSSLSSVFMLATREGSLTIRNCVIIGDFSRAMECFAGSNLTIIVERCIFVRTATSQVVYYPRYGTGSYTGTNNLFVTLSAVAEASAATFNNGGTNMNFTAWKAAGFDLNSVVSGGYNGISAITNLFVENPLTNGNFTLRSDTGIVFGDGSALTTAGPQAHWNWNTRAVSAGPPTRYPVMPSTLPEMKSYISDPIAWNFYP